ncbi:WD40 domain protein beta Propeller [Desulforamulus reducens MI-1]|uniref:WD40 domain protein beta Propeller n=1 Tax=Desulforamulus reducens (strain ATCC BAA-1160 / DSM 100696 / MI-1) TaxID=349161 RepID=A4J485_DESRM|nr:PD40 domain-containing protein [Desulforamulus reducens]ABO49888.1 WD40 domain protein beta Propeller [Desulforamulus reducens MI-1]
MTEERHHEPDNKVLPFENYLKVKEEWEDDISQLLTHMRQVREAVPVNRRLQVELRKKLLSRQKEIMNQNGIVTSPEEATKRKIAQTGLWQSRLAPFLGVLAAIFIVMSLTCLWRYANGQYHLEVTGSPQEITRFWTEDAPLQPAVSPDGTKILVVRGGSLVLLSHTGVQLAYLEPPEGATFQSPTWSPNGEQISFVFSQQGKEEIRQLAAEKIITATKMSNVYSQTTARGAEKKGQEAKDSLQTFAGKKLKAADLNHKSIHFSNLVYSPDGNRLAYVMGRIGEPTEVWVRYSNGEEKRITNGDAPTWSPNGKYLVVQRPGKSKTYDLWLVNVETGGADLLGPGENPTWSKNGYLAFNTVIVQERVLTFLPNGDPQYTVRQQVAEGRSTYLGEDGSTVLKQLKEGEGWLATSHLLIAPENRISGVELSWLRQQELSGTLEPKTLVLNEISKCEGQVFGPDDKWLLYARRDGDTVALLKLRLGEQWEKERN